MVRMRVTAEAIVSHARTLMAQGEATAAEDFIQQSLEGISLEGIRGILKGEQTLIEDAEGMGLAPDDDPDYRNTLQEVYGYRFRHQIGDTRRWYQIQGVVKWNPTLINRVGAARVEALQQESRIPTMTGWYREASPRLVAQALQDIFHKDLIIPAGKTQDGSFAGRPWVAVEETSEPPGWLGLSGSPQRAPTATEAYARLVSDQGKYDALSIPEVPACPFLPISTPPEPALPDQHKQMLQEICAAVALPAQVLSEGPDLGDLRKRVLEQAAGRFLDITLPDGRAFQIPEAPFLCWLFRGPQGPMSAPLRECPPWTPVCPQHLKQDDDDPYHSDWVVGAGISFQSLRDDSALRKAISDLGDRIYTEQFHRDNAFQGTVLSRGPLALGTGYEVTFPKRGEEVPAGTVSVIPCAHPDYLPALLTAVAVISEEGGALCHLARVGGEQNKTLIRLGGALDKLRGYMRVAFEDSDPYLLVKRR